MNSKYMLLSALADLLVAASYHPNSFVKISDKTGIYSRGAVELLHAKGNVAVPHHILDEQFVYAIVADDLPCALPFNHDNILDLKMVASRVEHEPLLISIENPDNIVTVESLFTVEIHPEEMAQEEYWPQDFIDFMGDLPDYPCNETNKKLH